MESHLFGLCPKISRDDMDGWEPLWGDPQGVWPAKGWLLHGAPLAHLPSPLCPCEGHLSLAFWYFHVPSYPLSFPIKGGGEELSTLTLSLIHYAMQWSNFLSPSQRNSFVEPKAMFKKSLTGSWSVGLGVAINRWIGLLTGLIGRPLIGRLNKNLPTCI